jgi:hypothetical protein
MAGVVFWFETNDKDVWSGRPIDLDAWRYAIKAGGIDKARCINELGWPLTFDIDFDFEILGNYSSDFLTWLAQPERINENIVLFDTEWTCPEGSIPLSELNHQEVDWYVFGASSGIPTDLPIECQHVYLPQNGTASLHSVHIASAVMLRRWESVN